MSSHNIFNFQFGEMYKLYVAKAEKKGRSAAEVDEIICWLTGYSKVELNSKSNELATLETFFKNAPLLNENRVLITGSVCGVFSFIST